MQDAQNSNPVRGHDIGCDEGRTGNDEFTGSGDAAEAAALGKLEKPPHGGDDLIVDIDCARGLSASMYLKMASRSVSACCVQTSLTTGPSFAKRRGAPFSKMRFGRGVVDVRALILQRLSHLRPKPCVVGLAVAQELDRERPLFRRARQQDANSVGNSHAHIFQDDRRSLFHVGVDPVCTKALAVMTNSPL